MKTNDIIRAYKTRLKKVVHCYRKVRCNFDADDVHQLRVEIKKLRAFIRFINLTGEGNKNKLPQKLKKFYQITGDIRNLQLHGQRINEAAGNLMISTPVLYLECLAGEERRLKKKARHTAVPSMKDFKKQLIQSTPDHFGKEIQVLFWQKIKRSLEALVVLPFYTDEVLHQIRKLIKDLMYNSKFIKLSFVTEKGSVLTDLKFMKSLTESLGDFHDLCISLLFLEPLYTAHLPVNGEAENLHVLRDQFQFRKTKMRDEILERLLSVKKEWYEQII